MHSLGAFYAFASCCQIQWYNLDVVLLLLQICGDASVVVFQEAAKAGVARAAFISVHDYKFPGGTLS